MAELKRSLNITLYDKNRNRMGWIGNPRSVTVTERYLAMGSAEITVEATDPMLPKMMVPGARVVITIATPESWREDPSAGNQIISGPLRDPVGDLLPGGVVTFQVQDDWRYLRNVVARVSKNGNVKATTLSDLAQTYWDGSVSQLAGTTRGLVGRYPWQLSPPPAAIYAETQVLNFIDAQINTRWMEQFGANLVTIPGTLNRGGDVRAIMPQVRFGTVEDYVVPLLRAGNLALRFSQFQLLDTPQPPTLTIWQPKTWATPFTPDSGVVRGGKWNLTYPKATRALVGGPGEETARAFRQVLDSTGLAALHGDLIEVFREATGAPVYWPSTMTVEEQKVEMYYHLIAGIPADRVASFEAFMLSAGNDALDERKPTSGVTVDLAESDGFRFSGTPYDPTNSPPTGFQTGDIITIAPSAETALAGLSFTKRITSTVISLTKDKGLTVVPHVGDQLDDPFLKLAASVRGIADASRKQNANR